MTKPQPADPLLTRRWEVRIWTMQLTADWYLLRPCGDWLIRRYVGRSHGGASGGHNATMAKQLGAIVCDLVTGSKTTPIHDTHTMKIQNYFHYRRYCGNAIGRASDLWFTCRGFESWLGTIAKWPCASYLHLYASVTKQYNLVPTGKVTAGLVESNYSLPPVLWLMSPAGWLPRNRDQLRAQRS